MAELDIAEKRVPQDGRFKLRLPGKTIDFRVSVMPSVHGEDAAVDEREIRQRGCLRPRRACHGAECQYADQRDNLPGRRSVHGRSSKRCSVP